MSLTAYIRYDSTGRLVPSGPIVVAEKPAVGNWQAVSASIGTGVTLVGKLKAYIKVDRFNKPLAGSLFLGKEKPATGKWIQVNGMYTVAQLGEFTTENGDIVTTESGDIILI